MPYLHTSAAHLTQVLFELASVNEMAAPKGQAGPWQRYVITQGENKIVGMRAGEHSEVHSILTEQVEKLNLRSGKLVAASKRPGAYGRKSS